MLDLPLAGPGSRAIAALVDLAVQLMVLFFATAIVGILAGSTDSAAAAAVFVTVLVLTLGAYPVLSEWLSGGRTLGKVVMGLRVVRDDAGPIGFRQALVRGVCSLVLEKPGVLIPIGTAAGLLTATASPSWKRIGDLLAGTVVIQDRGGDLLPGSSWLAPPPALWAWCQSADLRGVDDELALLLRSFVGRAHALLPAARADIEWRLARRIAAVVVPPPPGGIPPETLLVTVLAEHRRRAAG